MINVVETWNISVLPMRPMKGIEFIEKVDTIVWIVGKDTDTRRYSLLNVEKGYNVF